VPQAGIHGMWQMYRRLAHRAVGQPRPPAATPPARSRSSSPSRPPARSMPAPQPTAPLPHPAAHLASTYTSLRWRLEAYRTYLPAAELATADTLHRSPTLRRRGVLRVPRAVCLSLRRHSYSFGATGPPLPCNWYSPSVIPGVGGSPHRSAPPDTRRETRHPASPTGAVYASRGPAGRQRPRAQLANLYVLRRCSCPQPRCPVLICAGEPG
jgi:hypothetical protein